MSPEEKTIGLVYWNTWYRAESAAQLQHIENLESAVLNQGAEQVLFCLSEATKGAEDSLVNRLVDAGYQTDFAPTSSLRDFEEGLCFASRSDIGPVAFRGLRTARAIANVKTRRLGQTVVGELSVFSTHTSYPRPTARELENIEGHLGNDRLRMMGTRPQILGGDFNTLLSKKPLIERMETLGLTKLEAKKRNKNTVPFGPLSWLGVELDHVFVTSRIAGNVTLEIGPKGPSNHKPLLVTVTQ